jgi:aryl-phospho-beta-D-glucosidase BglC (GH1 family)
VLVAAIALPSSTEAAAPAATSEKMAYWAVQRRGANGGTLRVRPEWFAAAAEAGIEFVRFHPDELPTTRRDFLIGDADRFGTIDETDMALLLRVLDEANRAHLKVVLTMFSLPGCRWRQRNHGRDDGRIWRDEGYQQQALDFWRQLAGRLKNHPAVVAYNPLNEPHPDREFGFDGPDDPSFGPWFDRMQGTTADLNRFNERMVAAIRQADPSTPIMLDGWFHANPLGFAYNRPVADPRTLYAFHNLGPWMFAAYRINGGRYSYPDRMADRPGVATTRWTIGRLEQIVQPVAAFAARFGIASNRMIASEFWCDRRVGGAAAYIADELRIYEEHRWHWAFYEFRPDGGFTGLDYEIPADARFGEKYWRDAERGLDVEALKPRRATPIWQVIHGALKRRPSQGAAAGSSPGR